MFEKWGFLLSEIWVLLVLAALLGLLAGWLIWARRSTEVKTDTTVSDRLRAELDACSKERTRLTDHVVALENELASAKAEKAAPVVAPVAAAPVEAAPAETAPVAAAKPASLKAPRKGKADDLKLIKGVGPVLEKLCHKLGYYHFDQIAAWTAAEVAWVDENLEGFKGRVTRDEWVIQARDLAAGKPPRPGGEN